MGNAGIDYGRGLANTDNETGIRYGVISQNTIGSLWHEKAEPNYGNPTCPDCQHEFDEGEMEPNDSGCIVCIDCDAWIDEGESGDVLYPDEPIEWYFKDDKYLMVYSETLNSIFVEKSPYYTECRFCSPCCPGAGDLDSPEEGGVEAYCPGPDWFDGEPPFPIYRTMKLMAEKMKENPE